MAGKKQNQYKKLEYVECLFCHEMRHKSEVVCPECGVGRVTVIVTEK
jgi:hypothetical protein